MRFGIRPAQKDSEVVYMREFSFSVILSGTVFQDCGRVTDCFGEKYLWQRKFDIVNSPLDPLSDIVITAALSMI